MLAQDLTPLTLIAGDNVTALTNTSITIQCLTSGVPKPTVTWTKDGQEILIGGRYRVKDDGSLLISEADKVDNARYTCTAGSVSGKDSASSTVQVVGKRVTVIVKCDILPHWYITFCYLAIQRFFFHGVRTVVLASLNPLSYLSP